MKWNQFVNLLSSHFAITDWRKFLLALLGWTAAGAAGLLALVLLVMWGTSAGNTDIWSVTAANSEFQIGSVDGVIALGVFEVRDSRGRLLWGRRRSVSLLNVQPATDTGVLGFAFAGDLYGWALAIPHLFIIAVLLIVPAWWLLVIRNRAEVEERREFGLCRHCGYDLRESRDVCPECGNHATRAPALFAVDRSPAAAPSSPS